jgi:hypothetical protein
MLVGRQNAWRINQNYISTDLAVGRLGVKHHTVFHQVSAVSQPSYFVIESFISECSIHQLDLLYCCFATSADMTAI